MTPAAPSSDRLRVLLLLGQSPFDPTSGAAQSMRQVAEMLAGEGASVRALSTTGCEGDPGVTPAELLKQAGAQVRAESPSGPAAVLTAHARGVDYELFAVDHARRHAWEAVCGRAYDARLKEIVNAFRPHVALTFGGDPPDARRRRWLQAAGVRVVFALHNLHYRAVRPEAVDAFLAPTEFLARRYAETWREKPAVLPTPIDPAHAIAAQPEPVCVMFCNPEPAKGAALIVHLAARLGRLRPDVPLMILSGRAPATNLLAQARALGLELSAFPNILQTPPTARVADIWGACRVVLMPSIVEEAAGRVALEAMANGAVPLVSDRGALPETVGDAGHVIPWPADVTLAHPHHVPEETIERWWRALIPLIDDDTAFSVASAVAKRHAQTFLAPALAPRYFSWFQDVANKTAPDA